METEAKRKYRSGKPPAPHAADLDRDRRSVSGIFKNRIADRLVGLRCQYGRAPDQTQFQPIACVPGKRLFYKFKCLFFKLGKIVLVLRKRAAFRSGL